MSSRDVLEAAHKRAARALGFLALTLTRDKIRLRLAQRLRNIAVELRSAANDLQKEADAWDELSSERTQKRSPTPQL